MGAGAIRSRFIMHVSLVHSPSMWAQTLTLWGINYITSTVPVLPIVALPTSDVLRNGDIHTHDKTSRHGPRDPAT